MSGLPRAGPAARWREPLVRDSGRMRHLPPASDAITTSPRGGGLARTRPWRRGLGVAGRVLAGAVREHHTLLTLILAYVLAGYATQVLRPVPHMLHLGLYSDFLLIVAACWTLICLGGRAVWVMFTYRGPQALLGATWEHCRAQDRDGRRLAGCVVLLTALPLFMSTFGSFKNAIPVLHPFAWDERFMRWDAILHGGRHPWQWLQPLLGYPWVTTIINFCYHLWFFVMFGVVYGQMWSRRRPLRMQFFLTFVLLWIVVGTVLAIGFSSAGPCYYGKIVAGVDPYQDLMQYLYRTHATHPVWALDVQSRLWDIYRSGTVDAMGGITAMPSMHVAIAVLMALLGWRYGRWAGVALTAFAVMIFLGSIHLGWHYAIDGYVAAAITVVIWWAVGRWIKAAGEEPGPDGAAGSSSGPSRPVALDRRMEDLS
jgi:hypothetical protein